MVSFVLRCVIASILSFTSSARLSTSSRLSATLDDEPLTDVERRTYAQAKVGNTFRRNHQIEETIIQQGGAKVRTRNWVPLVGAEVYDPVGCQPSCTRQANKKKKVALLVSQIPKVPIATENVNTNQKLPSAPVLSYSNDMPLPPAVNTAVEDLIRS
jgi:hypothetical protein